jgi:dihydropyrimidinase/dihydroorotase
MDARAKVDLNIVNGKVVTPAGIQRIGIAIRNGRIAGMMAEHLLPPANEVIDASGLHVMPGVVDPEAHPGHADPLALDVRTETPAAAAAGVTTWGIHNPSPRFGSEPFKPIAEPEDVVSFLKVFDRGREVWETNSMVDFFFAFQCETDEQVEEIPRYAHEFGVTSYKFYCHTRRLETDTWWGAQRTGLARGFDDGTFFRACERAAEVGPPAIVMFHPENWEVARVLEQRLMAAGRKDMGAWDDRSPWFSEAHHIRAYGYFGKITGSAMYVQHCTNPLSIEEVKRARAEGIKMYAQTGAVWLYFTRDDWRINVPLRNREAIEAQWAALRDGIIDCVGSDHVVARGSRAEMTAEGVWSRKKSGFPSRVECLLPIMLHEGVNKGRISFERLVEVCCEVPARIFGIYPKKGALLPGSDADLVFVDLDREVTVRDEMIHSRPGWSLLTGHTIKGWPVTTILRGKVIARWKEGAPRAEIVGVPQGRYIPRLPGRTLYPVEDEMARLPV